MILTQNLAIFRYQPAAALYVAGDDSFVFLQGQFSNDLRPTQDGVGVYGLWLNQKGKVLADSFVVSHERGFLLFSQHSPGAVVRERLEAYVVADDVVIEDASAAWSAVTLLHSEAQPQPALSPVSGYIVPGCEAGVSEWFFPLADSAQVAATLTGAVELGAEERERRRIAGGVVAVPQDIGPGELPQEGALDDWVSHQKGCYLGQEVMARLRAMGQVRRRIFRLRAPGPVPARGTALFQSGRQVGEVRSATADGDGFLALGLLSTLHLDSTRALSLGSAEAEPAVAFLTA